MDPATIAAIGSAASGLGALGSAFGGGSDGGIDYRGAKKGIRWRVRDAKAAGIHPIYALGAPGIGQGIAQPTGPSTGERVGQAMQGMGQSISDYSAKRMAVQAHQANIGLQDARKDYIIEQTQAIRDARMKPAQGVAAGTVAQAFPAPEGPYDPNDYNAGPAFKTVTMPDGTTRRIGNQDAGLENPELMVPLFFLQDWLGTKGKQLRDYIGDIGTDWRRATDGY